MSQSVVNPYVEWLDIPESIVRPNYYQLLGLRDYEENEKKIRAAYYRRVAQVSVYQSGSNSDSCQVLLVELAEARDCLTDPAARVTYDARIQRKTGEADKKSQRRDRRSERSRRRSMASQDTIPMKPALKDRPVASSGSTTQHECIGETQDPITTSRRRSVALRKTFPADVQHASAKRSSSPFGMLSVKKTPEEIVADLIATRGLTPYQAQLFMEKDVDELVVGPYLLEEEFVEGSWGKCFLASRVSTGELAAVRILPSSMRKDVESLKKVIRKTNRIESKRIQKPIECGTDGDKIFLAHEYLSGEDLRSLVGRSGPLTAHQAVFCAIRIVEGLAAALKRGLTHLELRPSKVIVSQTGEVWVRDLALASVVSRRKRHNANPHQLTQLLPLEHLSYLAPELLINESLPDFHSDVYSVGCILYFLLTGEHVYPGSDPLRIVIAHRESPIPTFGDALPDVLDSCLQKMLAKSPRDRFHSYGDLHNALKESYRSLGPSGVQLSKLWAHVDQVSHLDDEPRPTIKRFHIGRAIGSGALAAIVLLTLGFGASSLMAPAAQVEDPPPVVEAPKPEPKGPTIVTESESFEIPEVEAVDAFQIR